MTTGGATGASEGATGASEGPVALAIKRIPQVGAVVEGLYEMLDLYPERSRITVHLCVSPRGWTLLASDAMSLPMRFHKGKGILVYGSSLRDMENLAHHLRFDVLSNMILDWADEEPGLEELDDFLADEDRPVLLERNEP